LRAGKKLWLKVIVAGVLATVALAPGEARASLRVHVSAAGADLKDAVVTAVAQDRGAARPNSRAPRAEMVQQNKEFHPFVLPVQVGTIVAFPNRDSFRHHVYSFSPAKIFELKLFGTGEVPTITFDREGVVVLGCNIHDNMLAYIYVVGTPYFATTNEAGMADVTLPAGTYTVAVWHPDQKGPAATQSLTITDDQTRTVEMNVALKRERRQQRPPAVDESRY
jgi:plastocyanin